MKITLKLAHKMLDANGWRIRREPDRMWKEYELDDNTELGVDQFMRMWTDWLFDPDDDIMDDLYE